MQSRAERFAKAVLWMAALLAMAILLRRAPVPPLAALTAGSVAALLSRYWAVGALTGAVMLPVLTSVAAGFGGVAFPASVGVAASVVYGCRPSLERLRRGEERQIGGGIRERFQPSRVGLWAPPAPHGLLGKSALSLGALLLIMLTVGATVLATVWLA